MKLFAVTFFAILISLTASATGKAKSLRIITDNDDAFHTKLELIKNAQKSLKIIYYIYSDDYSSSVFSKALIDKARSGVKIELLLDYWSNYKFLDLLSLLEAEGRGNIKIKLYGRPTRNIIIDAAYATLGCGENLYVSDRAACSREKIQSLEKLFRDDPLASLNASNINSGGSGLFLSALYTKSPMLLANAVLKGQALDLKRLRGSAPQTEEEKNQNREGIKKFFQLVWNAKTGNIIERIGAGMKLQMAFATMGDKVNPLYNFITGLIPIDLSSSTLYVPNVDKRVADWNHITDYTHHKLLLADGTKLQLGGRNIEDSYHMEANPLVKKYIFVDTDLVTEFDLHSIKDSEVLNRKFDDLFNFRPLVADLDEVRAHAPNDLVANIEVVTSLCQAAGKTEKKDLQSCVEETTATNPLTLDERMVLEKEKMERNAKTYYDTYLTQERVAKLLTWTNRLKLSAAEAVNARVSYIENLPFLKDSPNSPRLYGARTLEEEKSAKYIHEMWIKQMEKTCRSSTQADPQEIILHNAYFYPPANLMDTFSKMIDGRVPCAGVRLTILTNSMLSTDLGPVNVIARHSTKPLFDYSRRMKHPELGASIRYVEYLPMSSKEKDAAHISLHTKVAVFGRDTIWVGSANADVRSYRMDSNNGILIEGAPNLVREYGSFVNDIISHPDRSVELTQPASKSFIFLTAEEIRKEDDFFVDTFVKKYNIQNHLSSEQLERARVRIRQVLDAAYNLANTIISHFDDREEQEKVVNPMRRTQDSWSRDRSKSQLKEDARKRFNELFQTI